MIRFPLLRACLAIGLVVVAGPVLAKVAFPRADQNHDGIVTYEEAVKVMPRLNKVSYTKADANGDGVIDRGENPMLDSFYGYIVDQ